MEINKINEVFPQSLIKLTESEDGIAVIDGLKYCGSLREFDKFLEGFYYDIDNKSSEIENAYYGGDIELFTIKVHALKTSARMIGASNLSAKAYALEMAGKINNIMFIEDNIDELLELYRSYSDKLLEYMTEKQKASAIKKPISKDELGEAFDALREVCSVEDYGGVEMILEELNTYDLPTDEGNQISKIEILFHNLQWDEIEKVLS